MYESLNLGLHVGDEPTTVNRNRATLTEKYGPIQFMAQIHGNTVVSIKIVQEVLPPCDALVTNQPGIALAVQTADCIPLLLRSEGVVAAVHVGRKGLMNSIALRAVSSMRDLGAREITGLLGPSICGRCYEVSQEVSDEIIAVHPTAKAHTTSGTPSLNLSRALIVELQNIGVDATDVGVCTQENLEYYSYRRSGVTGRQAGIISL